MRYFIDFSYVGTAYHGWQSQPNAVTVQELMQEVFSLVLRHKVALVAAGRTDAGVHAKQMIAHFDSDNITNPGAIIHHLNALLPEDIAIREIYEVLPDAHARFQAIERTYEYLILREKDPFYRDTGWFRHEKLNVSAMNAAARALMEFEDFESFSKSGSDVKTFRCKIFQAGWKEVDNLLVFTITADRFLRNMVRAIVGTLLEVGQGKSGTEDVKTIIKSRDRRLAGASVPAKGLYLTRVAYPDNVRKHHG